MATKKKKPLKETAAARRQTQVAAESFLRFDPERQTLRERLAGAGAERGRQHAAADTSAEGVKTAAAKAKTDLGGIYGDVLGDQPAAQGAVDAELAKVAGLGGSSLVTSAITGERASGTRRLRESLANAQAETVARGVDAESGRVYAKRSADDRYASERAKIEDAGRSLDARQGAFETGRVSSLENADRTLNASRAREARRIRQQNADREDRQDFQAGENKKGRDAADARARKRDKKGERRTALQQGALEDGVKAAREQIKSMLPDFSREEIGRMLRKGETLKDEKGKVITSFPKVGDLTLRIAMDLEGHGYITKPTLDAIRRRKYAAKPIGPTKPTVNTGRGISGATNAFG